MLIRTTVGCLFLAIASLQLAPATGDPTTCLDQPLAGCCNHGDNDLNCAVQRCTDADNPTAEAQATCVAANVNGTDVCTVTKCPESTNDNTTSTTVSPSTSNLTSTASDKDNTTAATPTTVASANTTTTPTTTAIPTPTPAPTATPVPAINTTVAANNTNTTTAEPTTTTTLTPTPTPTPTSKEDIPEKPAGFSVSSFVGGFILCLAIVVIIGVAARYYIVKKRKQQNPYSQF